MHWTLLLSCLLGTAVGWHDFTNEDYHCWPLTASASNPTTWTCTDVRMEWIEAPPEEIKAEEPFSCSYKLVLEHEEFWDYAVLESGTKTNIFSTQGITDATAAANWCRDTECPATLADVSQENCCIWHINVHSCPLEESDFCGPWITPEGSVYTHSDVLYSKLSGSDNTSWTSEVGGLYQEGTTQLIAHIKFAGFQMALKSDIKVLPRSECGNDLCESEDGETCSTCPADCGKCPLSSGAIAGIVVGALLIILALVSVFVYFRVKQYKLMWDESWILPYEDIKPDKKGAGILGSAVSLQSSVASQQGGMLSGMQTQAITKQIFCKTAMYQGKAIAVKPVPKKQFVLTKQVRREVKQVRSMEHKNLAKFIGASIEVPNVCIATEYCPKGSLNDALLNDSIPLNWAFRFSMATDIARGMAYLHSYKVFHGKLKSNNCIIDDRWTVKITDFGIPLLRDIKRRRHWQQSSSEMRNRKISQVSHDLEQTNQHRSPYMTHIAHGEFHEKLRSIDGKYSADQTILQVSSRTNHPLPPISHVETKNHQIEASRQGILKQSVPFNSTRNEAQGASLAEYHNKNDSDVLLQEDSQHSLSSLSKTALVKGKTVKPGNQVAPGDCASDIKSSPFEAHPTEDQAQWNDEDATKSTHFPLARGSIFDMGLPTLRHGDKLEDEDDEYEEEEFFKQKRAKVYLPPEFVGVKEPVASSAADVYAFSIILTEIATRNDPYQDEDPDTVEDYWKPPLPDFTNDSMEDRCPSKNSYLNLIRECWMDHPSQRPSFDSCKRSLQRMNPNKMSPVDIMMAMMEKYSKHLESLVAERTAEVMIEKEKADRLLYSMIPAAVAEDLKRGKTIKAEQYSGCTIYFSDIVGFTNLSGGSTAMEVVALLNKLYTCFDSIIDCYDVYKVETIGDAYMVVSGVPKPNGIRHAREISNMACDLRDASKVFVIPHKPGEALRIRIGLHSGPVCAGVVGLKMPRYCLFGDTVNTASRMESNGEAYKVHLSSTTYDLLQQLGGFKCEKRGTIPIKGKGDMTTYWLTERDELKKKLDEEIKETHRKISNSNDSGYNEEQLQNKSNGLPHVPESSEPKATTPPATTTTTTTTTNTTTPTTQSGVQKEKSILSLGPPTTKPGWDDMPPIS